MDINFKQYLDSLKKVNTIVAPPNGGLTTFLLETTNYMTALDKRVLFVPSDGHIPAERLNHKDSVFVIQQDDFLNVVDNNEFMDNFDLVVIDNVYHLVESQKRREFNEGIASNARYLSSFLRKLTQKEQTVIIGTPLARNNLPYGLLGSDYISISNSILKLTPWIEEGNRRILIEIVKHREGLQKLSFEAEIQVNNNVLEIFKNISVKKNKFFNKDIAYTPESSIIKPLNKLMNKTLEEYLSNYSVNQINKFKEVLFLKGEDYPNFFFINTFHLLKETYHECNIDDFINDNFNWFVLDQTISVQASSTSELAQKFFKDKFTYKRTLNLFKNFKKAPYEGGRSAYGFDLILTLGIIYHDILSKRTQYQYLNDKEVLDYIDSSLHKDNFKKKNFEEILMHLEINSRGIKIFADRDILLLMEQKQKDFFNKNNENIELKAYKIEIPRSTRDLNKGAKFFNNCIGGEFFLDRFATNNDLLFFIKGDYNFCVHIDNHKKIVEVKKINNEQLNENELITVKNVLELIKI